MQPYPCCCSLGVTAGKSGQLSEICDKVAESRNPSVFSMGRENQLHMPGISDSLNANLGVALTLLGWKGREEKYKLNKRK